MISFYWENKIPLFENIPRKCSRLFLEKVLHYQKGKYYIILYDILYWENKIPLSRTFPENILDFS